MRFIIILALLLSGCAAQRTTITRDGKIIWEITGTGDQLVEVKTGDNEYIKIDSRQSSFMKDVLGVIAVKTVNDTPARVR